LPHYADKIFILGEGRAGVKLASVGESPGPPDVATGRPFTGPAGELLEKILLAIGLRREECYLTNVIKFICAGEDITQEDLRFFTPYLHRELAAVNAPVIIAFGNTPAKALLKTKESITNLRGEWRDYYGLRVMPTFNPAYLLRDPTKKREVWEDMKKVREALLELTRK
jgi:DNA polymerase